jgi:hypothetical protein
MGRIVRGHIIGYACFIFVVPLTTPTSLIEKEAVSLAHDVRLTPDIARQSHQYVRFAVTGLRNHATFVAANYFRQ